MRSRPPVMSILLCLVTGIALYVTRGVLDRILTADGSVRIALLPPWESLAGFVGVAALAFIALANRPRRPDVAVRPAVAELVLPLLALGALLLPYLPWLPDAVPALQMLAGPVKYLVWLLVGTQLAWVTAQRLRQRDIVVGPVPVTVLAAGIGLLTLCLTAWPASRLVPTTLFPGGDEPHYLVIAQSLWTDGDLKIENNHERGDYFEYFQRRLDPHYLTRGADGAIYSIHPVGLPILLAPVFALGGYPLCAAFMLALAALAAGLMWHGVMRRTGDLAAATFAVLAIVVSPPFALNSFTIYPEIAAALVIVAILAAMPPAGVLSGRGWRWAGVGLLAGLLPWLSTKYAPMSAAAVAVGFARLWLDGTPPRAMTDVGRRAKAAAALTAPYAASLVAWFAFFYAFWGSPLPQAPYGSLVQTSPANLVFGAPGLFFDQEYGLLAFAPVYILAATGLLAMWRRGGPDRRSAVEIVLLVAALLGTVGAFRIWWGGSASPGRPMVSGLLLFALPMAVAYRNAPRGSARRAAQHLLLWTGAWMTTLLTTVDGGLLINNGRDGTSHVLEYLSPLWEAWTLAPTFTYHSPALAAVHVVVWLAVAGAAAWLLARIRPTSPGRAALSALAVFGGSLLVIILVMPWLPAEPEWPSVDLRSRARLAALDGFDAAALPAAVIYDPLRTLAAEDAAPRLVLEVDKDMHRGRQPTRVLHNGRFSVPAGHYRVDLQWVDTMPFPAGGSEALGLQVGRVGPPSRTWTLEPVPGGRWHAEFDLPLDAGFIGLTGSVALERATSSITITPLSVVARSRRLHPRQVLSAMQYGSTMALFFDGAVYPERGGFWTRGGQRTAVALANDNAQSLTLHIHPGPRQNRVFLSMPGWQTTVNMEPDALASVTLPVVTRRVIELDIQTESGFVPADVNAASRDTRDLGVWIEVAPTERTATR